MHWLFVVNEYVMKCFPFQMKSKVMSLVTCMEEIYLRCTYMLLLFVETAKHVNSQQDCIFFSCNMEVIVCNNLVDAEINGKAFHAMENLPVYKS